MQIERVCLKGFGIVVGLFVARHKVRMGSGNLFVAASLLQPFVVELQSFSLRDIVQSLSHFVAVLSPGLAVAIQ